MTDPFNLYPPVIQHMKDVSENEDAFIAEVIAYAGRLEEEHRRIFQKLEEGTLHILFCNGDHTKRVGTEGMICNCPLGQDIHRLQRAVNSLSKDKERLDTLETMLKEDEHVCLRYTDAWAECGEMGAVLSQGPEEFWINDEGTSKYICKTLREAIDIYASKLRP